jgi:hypothetical protein
MRRNSGCPCPQVIGTMSRELEANDHLLEGGGYHRDVELSRQASRDAHLLHFLRSEQAASAARSCDSSRASSIRVQCCPRLSHCRSATERNTSPYRLQRWPWAHGEAVHHPRLGSRRVTHQPRSRLTRGSGVVVPLFSLSLLCIVCQLRGNRKHV